MYIVQVDWTTSQAKTNTLSWTAVASREQKCGSPGKKPLNEREKGSDEGNANKRVCILQYSKEALFNDGKQALILFVTIGKPAMEKYIMIYPPAHIVCRQTTWWETKNHHIGTLAKAMCKAHRIMPQLV